MSLMPTAVLAANEGGNGTEGDPYEVSSLAQLTEALKKQQDTPIYINLTDDITLTDHITIDKSVVIDGAKTDGSGNYSISGKIIAVSGNDTTVTFRNVDLTREESGTATLDVGSKDGAPDNTTPTVNLKNCTVSMKNSTSSTYDIAAIRLNSGTLNIEESKVISENNTSTKNGSYTAAVLLDSTTQSSNATRKLTVKNSTLTANKYYAIKTFPNVSNADIDITDSILEGTYTLMLYGDDTTVDVDNSTVKGWCAFYLKDGSNNVAINIKTRSKIECTNTKTDPTNNFAAILFEGTGGTVTLDETSSITCTGGGTANNQQYVASFYNEADSASNQLTLNGSVSVSNNANGLYFTYSQNGDLGALANPQENAGQKVVYGDTFEVANDEPYFQTLNADETIKNTYTSLDAAISGAEENDSIAMHGDSTETITVNKPLTIQRNGYTASGLSAGDDYAILTTGTEYKIVKIEKGTPVSNTIAAVGFKADGETANNAINAEIESLDGTSGTVNDCAPNTMYIILGSRVTGQAYTIQVKKGEAEVYIA